MKLEHKDTGPIERVRDEAISRRKFFKMGVAGAALLASLQFGTFASTMLVPRPAYAQTISIEGINFDTERLKETIDELYNKTSNNCVRREGTLPNGVYVVHANKPNEYTVGVSIDPKGTKETKEMLFLFPADKDKERKGKDAGKAGVDMAPFIEAINRYSKSEVKRFKIIAEETKSDARGDPVINGIAMPLDANGNVLGKHRGGYLAVEMSYFPDRGVVNAGTVLLLEPGVQEPVARK